MIGTLNYVTRIEFGCGAIDRLEAVADSLGMVWPMIVTDPGIRAAGILDRAMGALGDGYAGVPIFDDTPPNPTEGAVIAALDRYRRDNCDGVVALGGGSSLDLGKAVALLDRHPGPLRLYGFNAGGLERIGTDIPPLVAVPTTAGTGSEVGRGTRITMESGEKLGIASPSLIPRAVVADPELTLSVPAGMTAATGADALSHNIEAFLSPRHNPVADTLALEGARRVLGGLGHAVRKPDDVQARSDVMLGSLLGGLAMQKGMGAVHALSHAISNHSEDKSLHHGRINAVLMPAVLHWAAGVAPERTEALTSHLSRDGTPIGAYVRNMLEEIGLPAHLTDLGIGRGDIEPIANLAVKEHSTGTAPGQPSVGDYANILGSLVN